MTVSKGQASVKELDRLFRRRTKRVAYEAIARVCPHGFVCGECGECELS